MDDATLQIMVFGAIVAAVGAFASFMADRQRRLEGKPKASEPHTLL